MTRRTYTPIATALLLCAAAPAWTQEIDNMAEDRDIAYIEQCLQRAVEQQIPEDRIDDYIDRCINEFYERAEQHTGAEGSMPEDHGTPDDDAQGDADSDAGAPGD
jgi:hypothetical protein